MEQELSIYLHFPFCKQKCYYCDFNSYSGLDKLMPAYVDSLIMEMTRFLPLQRILRSVYFGGGTPSYIPAGELVRLLTWIREHFLVVSRTEITIEINPGTISLEGLAILKEAGFNRLSLGLQAAQDELLKTIGRIHSWQNFLDIYEMTRAAGFGNIGIDLIFGLPGQTIAQWQETLRKVVGLNPEHISAYGLQLEHDTPLAKMVDNDSAILPDDDEVVSMMRFVMDYLPEYGYEHYEISNYAKPGYRSVHNLGYWYGGDYLGFGAGAASTYLQDRWVNIEEPGCYIEAAQTGMPLAGTREIIDQPTAAVEALMLGLRIRSGLNLELFKAKFQVDLLKTAGAELETLLEQGFLELRDRHLALTDDGILISNSVIASLLKAL